ncbi:RNA-binding protein [uncultured virus]|uniref:RNA-binding protein n=1 Tax=uncultured virus TaxID=340016 RepID=A0A5Q0TWN6_9VIRU|nr:RNA-binding protein [uncultured virus]
MANIVVLPRIEIDNPFSELAEILKNEAIPMIRQLAMNKEQIAILSDTELTDHIPVLKRFAPELLTQDGKIDWNKVEEYLQSDDLFKQEVANYLVNTRRRREEFKNLPIGAKLEQLDVYSAKTNPKILKKEFMRHIILNKYQEAINNSNLSEDAKLFLLAHAPLFAELTVKNPAYFNAFLNILAKHSKKQDETKQESETGSWRLSLDEEKRRGFGIKLEKPKLTPPKTQITPPRVPKVVGKKKSDISSVKGETQEKQREEKQKQNTKKEAQRRVFSVINLNRNQLPQTKWNPPEKTEEILKRIFSTTLPSPDHKTLRMLEQFLNKPLNQ